MKVARTLLEIQKEMVLLLPPELRPAAMAEGCVIHALIIAAAAQAHQLEEQVVEMFNSAAVDSKSDLSRANGDYSREGRKRL